MPHERYKIGLLVANIVDPFSNQLAKGAMEAAEELDADLFIFPGKYIGLEYLYVQMDAKYEYQYNILFDIAAKAGLDYLIVAIGTIAYACSEERKLEIMASLGDTPKLCIAAELEGYESVNFDNRTGICQAVEYLAGQGKKHIGMLAGDLHNNDCMERYRAYAETMKKCGLEIDEGYVRECDISAKCAPEVEKYLDEMTDLDAVVCSNDAIAAEVYSELKKRGIRIGSDIAVTGFDDLPFAAEMDPPLASIKADAVEMGRRSVVKAVNYLSGREDRDNLVPTQFIPRQSSSAKGELYHAPETIFHGSREEIHDNLSNYISELQMDGVGYVVEDLLAKFDQLTLFLEENFINKPASEELLMDAVGLSNSFFTMDFMAINRLVKIYQLVDGAYHWALKSCPEENIVYVRRLYEYVYKRIANELVKDYRKLQDGHIDQTHINNIFIRDTLMFERAGGDAYASTLKRLCDIGGMTSYLYLLDDPVNHDVGSRFNAGCDWYFKAYAYGADTYAVPLSEQKIAASQMFRNEHLPDRRFTVVVTDLYSAELQYGIALIEPKDAYFFDDLELVTYQLSSSMRTIGLLNMQESILANLHNRNMALDQMSKIDELTGIFNRRGFYLAAEQLINKAEPDTEMVVCFADMDNLKLVNDHYGHIEGDFALRFLADSIVYIFGDGAVVGRMGGDEYAAIAPESSCGSIEEIRARKEKLISDYAAKSEKPYKINMSMGLMTCVCENSYDLRAAIDKADDILYSEKAKRKKEI